MLLEACVTIFDVLKVAIPNITFEAEWARLGNDKPFLDVWEKNKQCVLSVVPCNFNPLRLKLLGCWQGSAKLTIKC